MLLCMEKTKKPETYLARLKALLETLAPRVDQLHLMMIFGFPGETRRTLKQSLAYLLDECRVLSYGNVEICPATLSAPGWHARVRADRRIRGALRVQAQPR